MKILIAIPAHNEEKILKQNIEKLIAWCQSNLAKDIDWRLVIADSNSSDKTLIIAQELAKRYQQVEFTHLNRLGKGLAIKTAWQSTADVYCFMDADLATDLSGLSLLIDGIKAGNDLVIGSRFHSQSKVERIRLRKFISQAYRIILKIFFSLRINDAPCGFKAITRKVKAELLPLVKNEQWFFDSELVILAEKKGYKIKEIPVIWSESRTKENKSRVRIFSVVFSYLKKIIDLKKRLKNF